MSIRGRLAQRLRPFVERWAPRAPVVPLGSSRYRVIRYANGQDEILYDGVNGADARRWWEHYRQGPSALQFWQDTTLRDHTQPR